MHAEAIKPKLEHYANRKLTDFFQFDAFFDAPADGVMPPDENGLCVWRTETQELMLGISEVRVLVRRDKIQNRRDVVLALRRIANWIERDEESLTASCLLEKRGLPF